MRVPIKMVSMLGLLAGAPACVDTRVEAAPEDDVGDGSETGGEPSDPGTLEPALVHDEPPPRAIAVDSPRDGDRLRPRHEPAPEVDDELLIQNAPHASFPPPGLALTEEPHVSFASGTTATNDFHDQFGHAIVTGRFNALLTESILVAAPYDDISGTNRNSGKIYHFVDGGGTFEADEWQSTGKHNGRAGWALAVGDFNDDLYSDVAVGMPWNSAGTELQAGEVAIYRGSSTGLSLWTTLSQSVATREYGDRFGAALVIADFDNDGEKDDLAIGSPGEDDGRGAVYVYKGNGVSMAAFATLTETGLSTRHDHEHFGATLAAGDIRGSAHDDLLVGAPTETVSDHVSGAVFLYTGAAAALNGAEMITPSVPQHDQGFGRSLAVGDFDDDNDDDVVIGSPGANRMQGAILVLRNSASNSLQQWATIDEDLAGHDPEFGDQFGYALATGDIDDDGRADIVVGAPGEKYNEGAGLVFAFHVPTFLWGPLGDGWRSQVGLGANESGDRFGAAVAVMPQAGSDTLIVGAPSETLGNGTRSGAAFFYDGGDAFDALQWISQD